MDERREGSTDGLHDTSTSLLVLVPKCRGEGYSESVDHELREHGVRMLLVEPAYTSTGFEASSLPPDSPLPVYAVQREIAREVLAAALRDADDPSVVAKIVVKAATDTQPTLRYTAGSMAKRVSILRRFAPARIFDRQIRKLNQLTAHPAEPPVASQTLMARRGGTEPSAGKSRSTTTPKG